MNISHADHSKAWKNVTEAGIAIYMSQGTRQALNASGYCVKDAEDQKQINFENWVVVPFSTQHDAAEPLGFLILYKPTGEKFLYASDTFYIKYSFPGVNFWAVEANYCTDRLMNQYEAGEIEQGLYRRLLQSHMSLEHLKDYLAMQDLRPARKIVLLHLSDARSDEKRMEKEIGELTKVETVAAKAGLTVELSLYPF